MQAALAPHFCCFSAQMYSKIMIYMYICTMIFYFSGTGNTRWAAERLAELTNERLLDIAKVERTDTCYSLVEGERLGFCFPVHGWRPPKIVRSFIKKLSISNAKGHYCYALCTAGDNIGETIDILRSDLKKRGISLNSSSSLIMPESYVGLPFMDVDTPNKEKAKKSKAAEELECYAERVIDRRDGDVGLVIGHWPRINSRLIGSFFVKYLVTDKPFHVTESKCIKCGKCAEACPIDNVLWQKGSTPAWRHDGSCLACFTCYHHCPTHAIEYGGRTKNKGQYYFK